MYNQEQTNIMQQVSHRLYHIKLYRVTTSAPCRCTIEKIGTILIVGVNISNVKITATMYSIEKGKKGRFVCIILV